MGTILVVDDNPQNVDLARFLLERCNHKVIEAHNGQEAVDIASKRPLDLMLMDIQMPIMDGLQATKIIKAKENSPTIVTLTGNTMFSDNDEIMHCGCDGYIQKPINPRNFPNEVSKWIKSSVYHLPS